MSDRPDLRDLVDEFSRLPILDSRDADEIIGYDADGLPRPSG